MNDKFEYAASRRKWEPLISPLELLLGLFVTVILPMIVLDLLDLANFWEDLAVRRTAIAATIAFVVGWFLLRRLLNLPGVSGAVHGVPIMLIAFISAAILLLIARMEYSRYMLIYSTFVAVAFAYLRPSLAPFSGSGSYHLVPYGKIDVLQRVEGLETVLMTEPLVPSAARVNIVADFRADLPDEWERMLAQASLRGVPVYHYKQLTESLTGQVNIEHLSENFLGSLVPNQSYTPIKRLIDIIGSIILLIVASPILLILGFIIWLEDRGPVFYIQTRHGYGGKPFRMYKFRSMTNATPTAILDQRESSITKTDDDRITRVGRIIRRIRLDELPQLLNVLKGEMSLIGPRPEANALAEWYDKSLGFYTYRNIVKPGLTGWAQINQGHVATLEEVNTKLQYDFYYIKYFSFWLDFLIFMRTIHTVVTGFGSK
tara:strand:+ start:272 stop:1561 length:1290 start_codon:yes stop_codon:yes gene_type:complete